MRNVRHVQAFESYFFSLFGELHSTILVNIGVRSTKEKLPCITKWGNGYIPSMNVSQGRS
jgi:hypothetical protein